MLQSSIGACQVDRGDDSSTSQSPKNHGRLANIIGDNESDNLSFLDVEFALQTMP